MNPITLKNIMNSQINEIIQLGLSTPELHIGGEPEYYSEDMLLSFIKSPHDIYLAAMDGTILAGYFLASYNPYLKEAYLIDMAVKPEYRNKGISTMFFDKTNEVLTERGCVWMWGLVHEDNEKMMEINKKRGFIKGRTFTLFYKTKPF